MWKLYGTPPRPRLKQPYIVPALNESKPLAQRGQMFPSVRGSPSSLPEISFRHPWCIRWFPHLLAGDTPID